MGFAACCESLGQGFDFCAVDDDAAAVAGVWFAGEFAGFDSVADCVDGYAYKVCGFCSGDVLGLVGHVLNYRQLPALSGGVLCGRFFGCAVLWWAVKWLGTCS